MASLTTGLILTILIQGFIIKHTSVNNRDEIHKFIIVSNHECPTDHEYVVTIPLSSYLTGLSQVPHGYNDPDVDGPGCMLTSFDSNKGSKTTTT
jgi:hypothetical protein